jgi:hypothetical protein
VQAAPQGTNLANLQGQALELKSSQRGCCAAGLEELSLDNNQCLARLPASLATATSLTHLSLNSCPQLVVTVAEVEGLILSRMPRLRTLGLSMARCLPSEYQLQLHMHHRAPEVEFKAAW